MTFYVAVAAGVLIGFAIAHTLSGVLAKLTTFVHRDTKLCDRCGAELRRDQ